MDRVLGLDGGGTKTLVAIADRTGAVVATATGPGLDPTNGPGWEARLTALIGPVGPVASATLGLPFHGEIPEISARQIAVAASLIGPQTRVLNDVAVAFEGALAGSDGVLILAGTGSMAWARGPLGTVRTGGWGEAFGDEGSAHWIGREALALVSQHLDGRRNAPAFARQILHRLGIGGDQLLGWTYQQASLRAAVASVAVHVSALSAEGDPAAQGIIDRGASHLAAHGRAAAAVSGAPEPLRWSYAGGVFNDARLASAVASRMKADPMPPRLQPVGGAVLDAARAAGWTVGPEFVGRLSQSLSQSLADPLPAVPACPAPADQADLKPVRPTQ